MFVAIFHENAALLLLWVIPTGTSYGRQKKWGCGGKATTTNKKLKSLFQKTMLIQLNGNFLGKNVKITFEVGK